MKKAFCNSEKFLRVIPLALLLIGSVAGVICFYFIPSIIPAANVVMAIIIGAASDLTEMVRVKSSNNLIKVRKNNMSP